MNSIRVLSKQDWPPLLRHIPDPPPQMWIRGPKPDPETTWLCIIGARKHTPYGKQACESIISGLKGYNIGIVSGLATGIDVLAHKVALDNHMPVIAVPGSGLDDHVIYPRIHINIARCIVSSGNCLLSEFNPLQQAATWLFPKRNRIMAGIAQGTLVVESQKKSGTQITARLALDYNRDVMVVPGSIFSSFSEGPNSLLGKGAIPVTKAEDVLDAFNIPHPESVPISLDELSNDEKEIFIKIARAPISKDELYAELSKPLYEINAAITMLELKNLIIETNGVICAKI